jgi:PKD repeat protein
LILLQTPKATLGNQISQFRNKNADIMKKLGLLMLLFISGLNYAQDSISVLFIGNSYTYVNDLPTVFKNLTQSLGDLSTVDSKTNGGYTFQNHLSDAVTHTKIQSRQWDFVVLQGQSQEPSFPTDQVNSQTLPPAAALADSVYSNWYCSQAVYFMTWGRQNGDPQWDSISTFDGMNGRLRNAYMRIADSANASVSPVGVAWKYVRDNHPTINLYSGDGSHPSMEGTYLAACTFYSSLFRKSAVGATYTAGLDPTIAAQLQAAARLVVLDSISTWHLRGKEDLTVADFGQVINDFTVDFTNLSEYATSYAWDFGDGTSSIDTSPTHVYKAEGNYIVSLIATSECGTDTLLTTVVISSATAAIDQVNTEKIIVKTLSSNVFEILGYHGETSSIQVQDAMGRNVSIDVEISNGLLLNMDALSKGVYFVCIDGKFHQVQVKLLVH